MSEINDIYQVADETQLDRIERKLDEILAFKAEAETKLSGLLEGGGMFSMFGKMFGNK